MKLWPPVTISSSFFFLLMGSRHLPALGREDPHLPWCVLHNGGQEVMLSKKCCHESHNIQSWFAQLNEETKGKNSGVSNKTHTTVVTQQNSLKCPDQVELNMTVLLEHSEDVCNVSTEGRHECIWDYWNDNHACAQQYRSHCDEFGGALEEANFFTFQCKNTTTNDAPNFELTIIGEKMPCMSTSCDQDDRQKYGSFYVHHVIQKKYDQMGCKLTHINGLPYHDKTLSEAIRPSMMAMGIVVLVLVLILILALFLGRRRQGSRPVRYARLEHRGWVAPIV